ncbi:hypothetical protein KC345_g4909 [Hortaea werneckii]|nr:hypothetical protein KC345_g4909 [Hortaea werneckii]
MSAIYSSETLLPDGAPATDLPDNDWKGIFMSGYNPIFEGPLQRLQDGKAADDFTFAQWTPVGEPESNDHVLKIYYQFLGLFLETYHGERRVRMTILGGKTHYSTVATFSTAFPYARYELFRDLVEHLNAEQDQDSTDNGEVNCDLRVESPGSLLQRLSSGTILVEALDVLTWTIKEVEKRDGSTEAEPAQDFREGREDAIQDESQDAEADPSNMMDVDEPEQLHNIHLLHRSRAKRLTTGLTVHAKETAVDGPDTVKYTATDDDDNSQQIYGQGVENEASPAIEVDPLSAARARSSKKRGWTGWVETHQHIAPPVGSGVARVNIDNIIEGGRSRKRRS